MTGEYLIRVPLNMLQMTDKHGKVWPVAFDWDGENGEIKRVEIERVRDCLPYAEQKSGVVGDRYECVIDGKTEYLYYALLKPRKWFRLIAVDKNDYAGYYGLY
jgi:hypothetical protein